MYYILYWYDFLTFSSKGFSYFSVAHFLVLGDININAHSTTIKAEPPITKV